MLPKVIASLTLSTLLLSYPSLAQTKNKPGEATQSIPISLLSSDTKDSFLPKNRLQSKQPYAEGTRVVIGTDDRIPVLTRAYPWSAIGRIAITSARGNFNCTGTLIGLDIVLTNAHCLVDEQTKQPFIARNSAPEVPVQIRFNPSMIQGIAPDTARVIDYRYGTTDPLNRPGDDWAILKLDQPLGALYGYLGWRNLDFSNPQVLKDTRDRLTLVAYSGDYPKANFLNESEFGKAGETAGMNKSCSIEAAVTNPALNGLLLHRCDTNPGASGGPIFAQFSNGRYYILGLHSGALSLGQWKMLSNGEFSNIINRGVAVSRWASAARFMR